LLVDGVDPSSKPKRTWKEVGICKYDREICQ